MSNYVIYHLHTDISNGVTNIDSIAKYTEYIDRAAELNMKAIAFSEHGSVFEWLKKKEATEKAGLKYIHAQEFYITKEIIKDNLIRDNYHCVLIAKNYDGVKELNRLSSKAFNREDGHFYYNPRITFDELVNTSDNIIITTACLASILNSNDNDLVEKYMSFLMNNKERCFLEIQHHNIPKQIEYNKKLVLFSKQSGLRLITGTDTHSISKEKHEATKVLQKSKNISFNDEEAEADLVFKTYDELVEAYKKQNAVPMDMVLEAINNTNVMADMVEEFEVDRSYKYPHLWENSIEVFKNKIQEGIKHRGVDKYPNYDEYVKRIEYELKTYIHNNAVDFMLLMEDVISFCKQNNIPTGYGRGSVTGSVISWLLGITEIDSIKFNLNFERFMNTERISLADIDTDLPPSRIPEVKDYLYKKHGLYCSDIITFNTIDTKGAIRDIGRALDIPLEEVNNICKNIDTDENKYRNKYKKLFYYVDLVKSTVVSIGIHPCGLITSPISLDDNVGLCTVKTSNYPISQLYMKEIDSLNYVKLDLLKLDTAELIAETCKLANIPMVLPDTLDVNDENVWNSIKNDTTEIFQWKSDMASNYLKKILDKENINKLGGNVDKITLMTIGNSAIRPAGASYRDDLANGIVRKTGAKPIDDFLKPTFGYLVFQCQIIEFLHKYCGFTMGEGDYVRRLFSKKIGTEEAIPVIKNGGYLNNNKNHYIKGFIQTMKEKYNQDEEESEKMIKDFLQVILDASDYLFSNNHSCSYTFLGYACGWLRYYYPLEFLTTALNINRNKLDKIASLTKYAGFLGIKIKPIKFRFSRAKYNCDVDNIIIYCGIESVKNLNSKIAEEFYALRDIKYESFYDLLNDIQNKTSCDSKKLDILIRLNYFEEFGEIEELLFKTSLYNIFYGKKTIKKEKCPLRHEEMLKYSEYIEEDVKEIDIDAFRKMLKPNDLKEFDEILEQCWRHKRNGERNRYNYEKLFKLTQMPLELKKRFATKVTPAKYTNIRYKELLKSIKYNVKPRSIKNIVKDQQEYLGYISYINNNINKRYVVVTDLNTSYNPTFKGYCINNGMSCELKVHKTSKYSNVTKYSVTPFEEGDIIYMNKYTRKPKMKKTDNGFIEIPGEYIWWVENYKVVNELYG